MRQITESPVEINQFTVNGDANFVGTQVQVNENSNQSQCEFQCTEKNEQDSSVRRVKCWSEGTGCPTSLKTFLENQGIGNLENRNLNKINFSNKDCRGVNLKLASLAYCNFSNTELDGSTLELCNITNAELSKNQLFLCYFNQLIICAEHAKNYEIQRAEVDEAIKLYAEWLTSIQKLKREESMRETLMACIWSKGNKKIETEKILLNNPNRDELIKYAKSLE